MSRRSCADDRCSLLAKAGERFYPRKNNAEEIPVRNALDAIPECRTGQAGHKYFEFPITDPVFTGGGGQRSQGADRVLAISPSPGQGGARTFTYCLAITHEGAPRNGGFVTCT
jgi:hypothetical protein